MTALFVVLDPEKSSSDRLPPGVWFESPANAASRFAEGQFSTLLDDIHLVQYRTDLDWRADWASERYRGSGLIFESGSITARDLHVRSQIMVNVPLTEKLGLRYDRRGFRDRRFDIRSERLEAHGYVTKRFALVLAGLPEPQKEHSSVGAGLHWGSREGPGYVRVLVMDERFIHNEKRRDGMVFTRQPVRYIADTYWEGGSWRGFGSLDVGEPYRFSWDALPGTESTSHGRGQMRHGEFGLQWFRGVWEAGIQGRGATEIIERNDGDRSGAGDFMFDRRWGQGHGHLKYIGTPWHVTGLLGGSAQNDRYTFRLHRDGGYEMRAILWGAEIAWPVWPTHEFRLGYLGNIFRMERGGIADESDPLLANRELLGYADKVHFKWLHHFQPAMRIELLLSHQLHNGNFGGGSIKGSFLF
jgi:hypothetical protein